MLCNESPYLTQYEALQYRKHYEHLDDDAKIVLELHEFYTKPAKKAYCVIDDLLMYAYFPEGIEEGILTDIGEADFYNMPKEKGYVLGYNGILYTARIDNEYSIDGYNGYYMTANVNQWQTIDKVWKGNLK